MSFHELAHANVRRGHIGGSAAFREGFAEALSNGLEPRKLRLPIEPVLRGFGYEDADYDTAGLFLRFLMERHSRGDVAEHRGSSSCGRPGRGAGEMTSRWPRSWG